MFKWILVFFIFCINYHFGNCGITATGPKHDKLVVCYLGAWSVYRPDRGSFAIENIDPNLCTHLIYSFAGLDAKENSIKSLDAWQDLADNYGKDGYTRFTKLKEKYPHLKVSLAIGGWNEGSTNYSEMAADANRRSKFVASVVDFLKKYNFDGLDLDWEFPGKRGGNANDKFNFLLLVKELRAAFRKHNYLLTAAFGAGKDTIDTAYDVEGLSIYLDYIHMMCYDYHGAWEEKTGANAPLRSTKDDLSVEFTINYMLQMGAPASKLVMGIPLYGRTFLLRDAISDSKKPNLGAAAQNIGFQGPFTRENGFMGYNEICMELNNSTSNWRTYWDSETETPYAVKKNQVISYDNEKSIYEKVKLAMKKGLAGTMVWSIDTDDFHGDCSSNSSEDDKGFINFPLMRSINKAVETTLKDIENEIIDDNKTGGASRLQVPVFIAVVCVLFHLF